MMKRFLSGILLTTGLFVPQPLQSIAIAQTQSEGELYYTYFDKRIPLTQQKDFIGVAFKSQGATRGTRGSNTPLYLQLQQDLQSGGTRGGSTPLVQVQPLGSSYALVKLPGGTRGGSSQLQQRIQQQPYVANTLPVVSRQKQDEQIVVPNEIIISFDEKLNDIQKQAILQKQNLEIIRPLRFTQNRYLVRAKSATGTAILQQANQLNQTVGIKSATPNFLVARKPDIPLKSKYNANFLRNRNQRKNSFQTTLLPLQWHLNSVPLTACISQANAGGLLECLQNNTALPKNLPNRTDIRATDTWKKSKAGKGVLVAVLDSFIQWDHPDLVNNLYKVGQVKDKLPGEVSGWDFDSNDPDTRISSEEIARLRSPFQDSFRLSDRELLAKYSDFVQQYPNAKPADIANDIRNSIRSQITSLFHGTWVSGVVAARPQGEVGVDGVAPNAKILPVTVGKESPNSAAIVEGIGYAAVRGADVVNMSFSIPIEDVADAIAQAQKLRPDLVFVAAAGNENTPEIGFPASMKGVISVGATNIYGKRAPYSNFGVDLDLVAPGGDSGTDEYSVAGGILTTGGTWGDSFWQGITPPDSGWSNALDPRGRYMWVDGTSFASPVVAGVVALMKGEDPKRRLSRDKIIAILNQTASRKGLTLEDKEQQMYSSFVKNGNLPKTVSAEQFFFGNGLVNASAAVKKVQGR